VEEEHKDSVAPNMWQRANGTGGDMPTGYRPCPFCHAVIPWASERCPSCGRVLISGRASALPDTEERIALTEAGPIVEDENGVPW